MSIRNIGILTSGGDCGGLNAVVKGVTLAARRHDITSYVIPNGYAGLFNLNKFDGLVELTPQRLEGMSAVAAGSEAGNSRVKLSKIADGRRYERVRIGLAKFGLEALVISGGDDTGSVIVELAREGVKCVHVPKTMDLDLQTYSVGADSTISRMARFASDLRTTGRSHNRIMVLEVFGRYAGHTAFRSGIASEADAILIPGIAVDFDVLYGHFKERYFRRIVESDVRAGTYLIIVAEGMKDGSDHDIVDATAETDAFGHRKLAGAGRYVCDQVTRRLRADPEVRNRMQQLGLFVEGQYEIPEVRAVTPGHLVRCGESSAYDVNFGLEAGAAAVELLTRGICGVTVAGVYGQEIRYMKTEEAIRQRHVALDQVAFHEALEVCFGRPPAAPDFRFTAVTETPERHL